MRSPHPRLGRPGVALVAACLAVAVGACGGVTPPGSARHAPGLDAPVDAPKWEGVADVLPAGPAGALAVVPDPGSVESTADANRRPLWLLYALAGSRASDRTPEGISTRGGLAVALARPGTLWVGIGSYRGQLDGVLARSVDGGRSWSFSAVPGLYDPAGNLAAPSSEEVAVLVGDPRQPALLVSLDAGEHWDQLAGARALSSRLPAGCRPAGLSSLGSTLLVGTVCRDSPDAVLIAASPVRGTPDVELRRVVVPLGSLLAAAGRRAGVTRVVPPVGEGPVFVEARGARGIAIGAASPAALLAVAGRAEATAGEAVPPALAIWLSGLPASCTPTFSPDAVVARCWRRTLAVAARPGAPAAAAVALALPAGLGGAAPVLALLAPLRGPGAGPALAVLAGTLGPTAACWEAEIPPGNASLPEGLRSPTTPLSWRALVLPPPSTAASLGGGS
jgi:hypothetical protein